MLLRGRVATRPAIIETKTIPMAIFSMAMNEEGSECDCTPIRRTALVVQEMNRRSCQYARSCLQLYAQSTRAACRKGMLENASIEKIVPLLVA